MTYEITHKKYLGLPYRVREVGTNNEYAAFETHSHAILFLNALQPNPPLPCQHPDAYRGMYRLGMTKVSVRKGKKKKEQIQEADFIRDVTGSLEYCPDCGAIRCFNRSQYTWHKDIEAFLKHCIEG